MLSSPFFPYPQHVDFHYLFSLFTSFLVHYWLMKIRHLYLSKHGTLFSIFFLNNGIFIAILIELD